MNGKNKLRRNHRTGSAQHRREQEWQGLVETLLFVLMAIVSAWPVLAAASAVAQFL